MGVHLNRVVCEGSPGYQEELEVWRGFVGCMCCPPESTEEGSGWGLGEPQYLETEQRRRAPGLEGELWDEVHFWKKQDP